MVKEKLFDKRQPNIRYGKRIGAYIIPVRADGTIPVVRTPRGIFLLGGGVEKGESHEECIKRECLEEIGAEVLVGSLKCKSDRYHYAARFSRHMHTTSYFYTGELLGSVCEPTETNHELIYLSPDECRKKLFLKNQIWAVKVILGIDE